MPKIKHTIKLFISIIQNILKHEWYSPQVIEMMEKDKELYKLFEGEADGQKEM